MTKWYVSIDNVPDDKLEFIGYLLVREDEEFFVYTHIHSGDDFIIDKNGPKFLWVDDINDAIAINARVAMIAPYP